jgi:hypothetical protein
MLPEPHHRTHDTSYHMLRTHHAPSCPRHKVTRRLRDSRLTVSDGLSLCEIASSAAQPLAISRQAPLAGFSTKIQFRKRNGLGIGRKPAQGVHLVGVDPAGILVPNLVCSNERPAEQAGCTANARFDLLLWRQRSRNRAQKLRSLLAGCRDHLGAFGRHRGTNRKDEWVQVNRNSVPVLGRDELRGLAS